MTASSADADPSADSATDSSADAGSRLRLAAVAAVFVLLGSSLLVRSATAIEPVTALGLAAGLAVLAFVVLARRGASSDGDSSEATDGDDGNGSDVWDAIPSWQYDGRHVESGGLARGEQEQALQDIQRQADELEERR